MTLTLNLSPELEQYLIQEASRSGLSVDVLATNLLADHMLEKQKQTNAIATLQSWIDDSDANEQEATGQYLIRALDEDRLSNRSLFPSEMKGITW